jgi:hypothetical protein
MLAFNTLYAHWGYLPKNLNQSVGVQMGIGGYAETNDWAIGRKNNSPAESAGLLQSINAYDDRSAKALPNSNAKGSDMLETAHRKIVLGQRSKVTVNSWRNILFFQQVDLFC